MNIPQLHIGRDTDMGSSKALLWRNCARNCPHFESSLSLYDSNIKVDVKAEDELNKRPFHSPGWMDGGGGWKMGGQGCQISSALSEPL